MQKFITNQLSQFPTQLTIAQVVDQPALQSGLQQALQGAFEQQYGPVEQKMKRDVEEMKRAADTKVAEIRKTQTAGLQELTGLEGQMRGQMENQERLIWEIERVVGEKNTALTYSHNQATAQIYDMQGRIRESMQRMTELKDRIEEKQRKLEIQTEIDIPGGDRVKFTVFNRKLYSFDDAVLRFLAPDYSSYYSDGVIEPTIPGKASIEVSAPLPKEFPPNVAYQVAICRKDEVISNYKQFIT